MPKGLEAERVRGRSSKDCAAGVDGPGGAAPAEDTAGVRRMTS